jgi:hypothetical protein
MAWCVVWADHALHGHDVRLSSNPGSRHVLLLRCATHRTRCVFQAEILLPGYEARRYSRTAAARSQSERARHPLGVSACRAASCLERTPRCLYSHDLHLMHGIICPSRGCKSLDRVNVALRVYCGLARVR